MANGQQQLVGFRARGLVNPASGLPNLNALRLNKAGRSQALIVTRILNYSEIVATLPSLLTCSRGPVDHFLMTLVTD